MTKLKVEARKTYLFYAAHLSADGASAASVRCEFLIRAMREAGLRVEVWSNSKGPAERTLWTRLPTNRDRFFVRLFKEILVGVEVFVRLLLLRLKTKCLPLVILSSPPYISCWLGALSCRLFHLDYLLDVRDLYPEAYFHQGLIAENSWLGRTQKAMAKRFYLGAQAIFVVTQGLFERIAAYGVSHEKLTLVRNGYDDQMFKADPAATSGVYVSPLTCIFHGNLGHMQDVNLLKTVAKEIFKQNPNIQFIVLGSGPQENILLEDVPPNLKYLGEKEHSKIVEYLVRAQLGLSFRKSGLMGETAFPVKIYEYIGMGLPVIVTPKSEAGEVVESLGLGFQFDGAEIDPIVRCILRLAADQTEYDRLASNMRVHRNQFSRQKSAEGFMARIRELQDSI